MAVIAMISNRDLSTFSSALLDLYAPGLDFENYSDRGFRFLTRLSSVDLTVHGVRDARSNYANILLTVDRPVPGIEHVLLPFGLLAPKYPWFCANFETHDGKPHYRSDFYSDRQYRSLDIHSEVFRRWNHEHFMTMCVHFDSNHVFFFGFSRTTRDFSDKERSLLAMAQPHLMTACRLAKRLSAAKPWSLDPQLFSQNGFTPRESEVLYWLTEGKSNIEIAMILRLGLPTVKGYLTSIFNKTGTGNRLAATLHAVELAKKVRAREVFQREGPLIFQTRSSEPSPYQSRITPQCGLLLKKAHD